MKSIFCHNFYSQEEAYLQEAIKQSLEKKRKEEMSPAPVASSADSEAPREQNNLLLDFFDAPAPAMGTLP